MWHVGREFAHSIYRYPAEKSFLDFILRTIGGSWMARYLAAPLGIRTLHPFLDVDLLGYCLQLPRDARRPPEGENKSLLRAAMRGILPGWLEPANPFDFWIGIDVKGAREAHETGLAAVFADANVDLVLCTLLAPGNADFAEFGDLMRRLRRAYEKPVALVIYGGDAQQRWTASLEGADIPVLKTTRAAARALSLMVEATM